MIFILRKINPILISLNPNPFINFIKIKTPDDLVINQIIITNQLGQTVYESYEKDIILT